MAERGEPGERGGRQDERAGYGQPARVEEGFAGEAASDEGVLTLVCFKCGTEYYFAEGEPPSGLTCEKCANTVFRTFFSREGDEVAQDFADSTVRDLDPDDAEGEAMPGDVLDLNPD